MLEEETEFFIAQITQPVLATPVSSLYEKRARSMERALQCQHSWLCLSHGY